MDESRPCRWEEEPGSTGVSSLEGRERHARVVLGRTVLGGDLLAISLGQTVDRLFDAGRSGNNLVALDQHPLTLVLTNLTRQLFLHVHAGTTFPVRQTDSVYATRRW
jgi:hypothetical protein